MLDLTSLDYIYVGVLVASTIWAAVRGGIYEMVATLSWVIAAFAARFISPLLDGLLQDWFGLTASTVGTLVASYFVVFFVILMLVGFFNQRLRDRIQNSIMKVTDRTLGIIFGLIRGIVIMGLVYWATLWYYSDAPRPAPWVENARTRPIMQNIEILNNLINPAVSDDAQKTDGDAPTETGYKSSERSDLEKQLLQIANIARAEEERAAATTADAENSPDENNTGATDATASATAEMENSADEIDTDDATTEPESEYGTPENPSGSQ